MAGRRRHTHALGVLPKSAGFPGLATLFGPFWPYPGQFCGLSADCHAKAPLKSPISDEIALTLAPVTSQSNDARWRRPGESPEPTPGHPASARLVDPEDDLTPVGYPGDFGATTVIPYQDLAQSGGPDGSAYNLLDQQEPLPYVHPQSGSGSRQPSPLRLSLMRTASSMSAMGGVGPRTSVC